MSMKAERLRELADALPAWQWEAFSAVSFYGVNKYSGESCQVYLKHYDAHTMWLIDNNIIKHHETEDTINAIIGAWR